MKYFYGIVLVGCLLFSEIVWGHSTEPMQPFAQKGILDLTGIDLETHEVLHLGGEWGFYWNQLWSPEDFKQGLVSSASDFFVMHDVWNHYAIHQQTLGAEGYATFRLKVKLRKGGQMLGFKFLSMGTAYRFWINGQMVSSMGQVGTSAETSIPEYTPQVRFIQVNDPVFDITLQVSNFHHRLGGPWYPVEMGLASTIHAHQARHQTHEMMLFGSIMIMALYHFGLFYLRRNDKSPLFFGLLALTISIRIMVSGERYLHSMFSFPWGVFIRIEYIAFFWIAPMSLWFIRTLFPEEMSLKFTKSVVGISVLSTMCLVLPPRWFSHITPIYQYYLMFIIVYVIYILVQTVRHHRESSRWMLGGFSVLCLASLNDILYQGMILQTGNWLPAGLLVFIFIQSFILSIRFSRAFFTSETLLVENRRLVSDLKKINENLETIVSSRTEQLRQKNSDMQSMLQNLPEGILMITNNNRIHHEYSAWLETILETADLADRHWIPLIFEDSNLTPDVVYSIETAVIACLEEDASNFMLNHHILVNELEKNFPGNRKKNLELTWAPICNENEEIEKIMLSLRDVTKLKLLQKEASERKRDLIIIGEILSVVPHEFQIFMKNSLKTLTNLEKILTQKTQMDKVEKKKTARSQSQQTEDMNSGFEDVF
ncbi:MAG: 7TM-DISM domain-containing protein [SAR324 cluster bacterium]|nr:7TM-DISM domain-containing protein [SAR324 cluster bacterium]